MNDIFFFSEKIDFQLSKEEKIKHWIQTTIQHEKHTLIALNYIFCNDEYLHQINVAYLQHDTYTDIITFDNSEDERAIEGDIFISIDRIKANAHTFQVPFSQELPRVMIHGVLHLLGYADKTEEEKKEMRRLENHYLNHIGEIHPL